MWTRKRTFIDGECNADGDWLVLRHGQEVGRVYPVAAGSILGAHYFWCIWTDPTDSGKAETLGAALEAVRGAIRARWPDGVAVRMVAPD